MNNNASLDNTCEQDYSEFLNEYLLQTNSACNEPETHYEGKSYNTKIFNFITLSILSKPFASFQNYILIKLTT